LFFLSFFFSFFCVAGFLGAGKTTLLQSILKQNNNNKRIAIIENEFAVAYGIESEFLAEQTKQQREKGTYDEIYEFSNGKTNIHCNE
jgi:G3E family GTPase